MPTLKDDDSVSKDRVEAGVADNSAAAFNGKCDSMLANLKLFQGLLTYGCQFRDARLLDGIHNQTLSLWNFVANARSLVTHTTPNHALPFDVLRSKLGISLARACSLTPLC
jgi:hypothetical protein